MCFRRDATVCLFELSRMLRHTQQVQYKFAAAYRDLHDIVLQHESFDFQCTMPALCAPRLKILHTCSAACSKGQRWDRTYRHLTHAERLVYILSGVAFVFGACLYTSASLAHWTSSLEATFSTLQKSVQEVRRNKGHNAAIVVALCY
jgi:hypothetical protein